METATAIKNKPLTGQVGRIRYKVWTNVDPKGKTRYSVDLFRSFSKQDENGAVTWRDTHNFSEQDLQDMPALLQRVEILLAEVKAGR